jgi:hypothetical protein
MIVMPNEGGNLRFEFSGQEVILEQNGECHDLCVSGPAHAVSDTQASKRSPNIMAN